MTVVVKKAIYNPCFSGKIRIWIHVVAKKFKFRYLLSPKFRRCSKQSKLNIHVIFDSDVDHTYFDVVQSWTNIEISGKLCQINVEHGWLTLNSSTY